MKNRGILLGKNKKGMSYFHYHQKGITFWKKYQIDTPLYFSLSSKGHLVVAALVATPSNFDQLLYVIAVLIQIGPFVVVLVKIIRIKIIPIVFDRFQPSWTSFDQIRAILANIWL